MSRPTTPVDTGNRFILCKILSGGDHVWAITIHTERDILESHAKRFLLNHDHGYMILELPTKQAENILFDNRLCPLHKFERDFGKWTPEIPNNNLKKIIKNDEDKENDEDKY